VILCSHAPKPTDLSRCSPSADVLSPCCGLFYLLLQSLCGVVAAPFEGYMCCGPLPFCCVGCMSCGLPLSAAVGGVWGAASAAGRCGLFAGVRPPSSLLFCGWYSPILHCCCVADKCNPLSSWCVKWLWYSPPICCCDVTVGSAFFLLLWGVTFYWALWSLLKLPCVRVFINWISEWGFGYLKLLLGFLFLSLWPYLLGGKKVCSFLGKRSISYGGSMSWTLSEHNTNGSTSLVGAVTSSEVRFQE